jgi:hypothetical protein
MTVMATVSPESEFLETGLWPVRTASELTAERHAPTAGNPKFSRGVTLEKTF